MADPDPDDATIANEELIWRRVPHNFLEFDANVQRVRPTSQAFQNTSHTNGMSAAVKTLVLLDQRCEIDFVNVVDHASLVEFTATFARSQNQRLVRKPVLEEPGHIEVVGKKSSSVRKAFVRECSDWVVAPSVAVEKLAIAQHHERNGDRKRAVDLADEVIRLAPYTRLATEAEHIIAAPHH